MLPNDQKYDPLNEVQFDNFGQSVGNNQCRFSSWIGVQARTRLSILQNDWHQIDEDDKEQLWLRVKAHFNIKDDERRTFVIKIANGCWKSFKKRLISKYVAKGLDATNDYPYILKEEWETFKGLKSTAEFLERSRKNRENALKNKNPARVGPRGYRGRKVDWEKQAENNELKSLLDGIQDTRARDWVHARIATDESGSKVLPAKIKPVVDEIIEYDRKKSHGSWIPPSGVDPLIQVLGPEHPGRTRAVGYLVGLKKGLQGVEKKKRNNSKKEALAEITGKTYVPDHMIDQPQSGQMSNIPVGSSEMKKSSSASPHFDPLDLSEALPCYLLVPYGKMTRCARGMVYPLGDGLIHGIPLEDDHMRVAVDIVYPKYNGLPLPMENENADMHVLEDARHAIIQWPHKAIVLVRDYQEETVNPDVPVHTGLPTQPLPMTATTDAKKTAIKIPQKWKLHANIIKDKSVTVKQFFKRLIAQSEDGNPIHIVADSGIFENQSYEFNIELDDMVRLISERWLDISIIAWFQIMLHSLVQKRPNNKQSAFLNPYSIQAESCVLDGKGVTDYIVRAITHHHDKKLLVAPYWQSEHWVLFVIDHHRRMGYILDSWLQDGGKTKYDYKVTKLVERAISRYIDGVDSEGRMGWTMVECNQQSGGWECGYYVLRWLFAIAMQGPGILFKKDCSPISRDDLDRAVNTWVNKFVELNRPPHLP